MQLSYSASDLTDLSEEFPDPETQTTEFLETVIKRCASTQSVDMRCFSLSHFMDSLHLLTFNVKDIENIWECTNDLLYSDNLYAKEVIFKFAGKIMVSLPVPPLFHHDMFFFFLKTNDDWKLKFDYLSQLITNNLPAHQSLSKELCIIGINWLKCADEEYLTSIYIIMERAIRRYSKLFRNSFFYTFYHYSYHLFNLKLDSCQVISCKEFCSFIEAVHDNDVIYECANPKYLSVIIKMSFYDYSILKVFDHLAIPDKYLVTILCNLLIMLNDENYSIDVKYGIIVVIEQYYLSNPVTKTKIDIRVILQHYYDYIRGFDSYNNNKIIPRSHFLCTNNILSSIVHFFNSKKIDFCFIDYELMLDILILCLNRYDELIGEGKPENSLIMKIRPNDFDVSIDAFKVNIVNCYEYLSLVEFEQYSNGTKKYFEFKRLVRNRNWSINANVKSFILKSEVQNLNLEKSNFVGFLKEFASFYIDEDNNEISNNNNNNNNIIENELQSEAILLLRDIYLKVHQIYDEEFIINVIIPHIKKLFLSQQGIQIIATLWKKCKISVFPQFIKETDKILEVPILKNVEWLNYVMALFNYLLLSLCKNHKTKNVLILYKYFIQLFQKAEHPIIHYHLLKYFQLIECDYHNHFVLSVKDTNGSVYNYILYDSTCNIDEYNKNPKLIYFDIPPLLQTLCNFITGQKIYQLLISSIITLTKLVSFPIFLKNYSLTNLVDSLSYIIHSPTGLFRLPKDVLSDDYDDDSEDRNDSSNNNDDVRDVNDNGDIEGNESDTIKTNLTSRNRNGTIDSTNNNDNEDIVDLDPKYFKENDSYKLLNEYIPTTKEEISRIQNKCYILLADLSIYNNQMSTKDADTIFKNLTDAMNNIFHQIRHYDVLSNNSDSDTMLIISRKRATSTCTTTLRTRFNSIASERGGNGNGNNCNSNFSSNNGPVIHQESLSDYTPESNKNFSIYNNNNNGTSNSDYTSILYDSQLVLRHLLYALISFIVKSPLHFSLSDCLVYLPDFILQMNMTQDEYPLPLLIMSLSQCADYIYNEIRIKGYDINTYYSLIEEWIMRITDITVAVLQLEKDCTTVDFLILQTIRVYIKWLNECPHSIAAKSAEKVFPYLLKRQHSKNCLTSTVAIELLYEVFSPYKLQKYPPPVDSLVFSDKIKVNDKEYSAVSHYIYKNMLITLRYGLINVILVTIRKTYGVSQYVVELDNITTSNNSIRYLPEFNVNYQQQLFQQNQQAQTIQKRKHSSSVTTPQSPSPFYTQIANSINNPIYHLNIPLDYNQGSDSNASDTSNSNSARSTPSFTPLPNTQLNYMNQQTQKYSDQPQQFIHSKQSQTLPQQSIPLLTIPTTSKDPLLMISSSLQSSSPGIPSSIKFPPSTLSTIAEANNSCRTEDALSCDSRNASDYMNSPSCGRCSPTVFSDLSVSSSKERALSDDSIKLSKGLTDTLNHHSSAYSTDSDNTPVDLPSGLIDLSERDDMNGLFRMTGSLGDLHSNNSSSTDNSLTTITSTSASANTTTTTTATTTNTVATIPNSINGLPVSKNKSYFKQHSNPESLRTLSSKIVRESDIPTKKIRKVYSEVFRQSSYDRIRSLSHDSSYSHFKKDHRKMKDLHSRRTSSIGNSDGDHQSSSDKNKSDKTTRYSAISQSDSNLAGMLQQKIDQQIMESPMSVSRRSIVILPSVTTSTGGIDNNNSNNGVDDINNNGQLPVGRNSKNSLVSSEYYCNSSNHSSANNLILPSSALPDTNGTYYNSCSFDDTNSSNSESSLGDSSSNRNRNENNNKLFSTTSPPALRGKNNCAFDILLENNESSSSDSTLFNESYKLKPIQTPPASFTLSPKHINQIPKISLEDEEINNNNNNSSSNTEEDNNNNQGSDLADSEFRVSEFSSSLRSEAILTPPNPYIIQSEFSALDMELLQKKTHKHHRHHRHHKNRNNNNNNMEMSPRDDNLSLNPATTQTILSSHFKKPFIDIQSLGLIDPLGSCLSHWGILNGISNENCPLLVENDKSLEASIKVLDHTNPKCCHKIGVLYAKSNQFDEWEIYKNTSGCVEYEEFLQKLGKYYKLSKIDPNKMYLGGLSQYGSDGEIVLINSVSTSEVVFHVTTLFPTNNSDENHLKESLINKKKHLGNDFVNIIYTFNQQLFQRSCPFKTNFTSVFITVTPISENYVKVLVYGKEGIPPFGPLMLGTYILSNDVAPQLVLQTAVNADIVCRFIYEDIIGPVLSVQERAEQLSKLYNKIKQTCPRPLK